MSSRLFWFIILQPAQCSLSKPKWLVRNVFPIPCFWTSSNFYLQITTCYYLYFQRRTESRLRQKQTRLTAEVRVLFLKITFFIAVSNLVLLVLLHVFQACLFYRQKVNPGSKNPGSIHLMIIISQTLTVPFAYLFDGAQEES